MKLRSKKWPLHALKCALLLSIAAVVSPKASAAAEPCVYNNQNIISTWRGLNNDRNMVIVIAHRGWWGEHRGPSNSCGADINYFTNNPENSFWSIMDALHTGFEAVEVDIKMTRDGVPILMHDYTLGRTTNIYQLDRQNKYDPYSGRGFNPYVNQVNWYGTLEHGFLLSTDRGHVTSAPIPAFAQLLDQYKNDNTNGLLVLDVKDRAAMQEVWRLMNDHADSRGNLARNWVAVKFNLTTYPNPADLEADLYRHANPHGGSINNKWNEPFLGIPVVTNNMLDKLPNLVSIEEEYMQKDYTLGVEVNLNMKNGRLQQAYNAVGEALHPVGIFNPLADPYAWTGTGENQAFFQNTGRCCYRLYTVRFGDNYIERQNWSFLYGDNWKSFDFITTDEAGEMINDLTAKHLRQGNNLMMN